MSWSNGRGFAWRSSQTIFGSYPAVCAEAIHRVVDRSIQPCGGDGVSEALPLIKYSRRAGGGVAVDGAVGGPEREGG